jgi:hypothetical protein
MAVCEHVVALLAALTKFLAPYRDRAAAARP